MNTFLSFDFASTIGIWNNNAEPSIHAIYFLSAFTLIRSVHSSIPCSRLVKNARDSTFKPNNAKTQKVCILPCIAGQPLTARSEVKIKVTIQKTGDEFEGCICLSNAQTEHPDVISLHNCINPK